MSKEKGLKYELDICNLRRICMKNIDARLNKIIPNALLISSGTSFVAGTTLKVTALYWISSLLLISWYRYINKK